MTDVWISRYASRHFDFIAAGRSPAGARLAMAHVIRTHIEQTGADDGFAWEVEDGMRIERLPIDGGMIDDRVVEP